MSDFLNQSGGYRTSAKEDIDGTPVTEIVPKGSYTLVGKVVNVPAAGTRVQLPVSACREVTIIAKKGNKGSIYIGGSDVSSTVYGVELYANESFTFNIRNTNLIYINASISGEGVSYVAI